MAFKSFPSTIHFKTVDTSEITKTGSFKTANSGELGYMRVLTYICGTLAGPEQIRIKICANAACDKIIYTSDWSSISAIKDENGTISTGNWLGWLRVTFNRENLNNEITYYGKIELQNYTRNVDVFYIGFGYDLPVISYDAGEDYVFDNPIGMQIFPYEDRD